MSRGLALLAVWVLIVVSPVLSQEPKKTPDKKADPKANPLIKQAPGGIPVVQKDQKPDVKKASELVVAAGAFNGRLSAVKAQEKTVSVRTIYQYAVLNQDAFANLQELQQQYFEALQLEDPEQRFAVLQQIVTAAAEVQQNLYDIQQQEVEVELDVPADIKVRRPDAPMVLDEKGNPRKATGDELLQLKGPANLPGFTGKFEDVQAGQAVQVFFVPKQGGRPSVTMIVILVE